MADAVALDLAAGEVHTAGSGQVELISADKRNSLPEKTFALPAQRKYPLDTAARVRNAAARLEQMHKRGKVSDADYKTAKGHIASAAKKFGIDSEYNASDKDGRKPVRKSIHVRADLAPGGSLHVRHNMTARSFYDGEGVLLSGDDAKADAPVWIQVAKSGSFAGHAVGPFELNEKVFGEIIANFKSTKNRAIAVDYEHASEQDATSGTIPVNGAPAQGWIRDLKVEGGNLWGLVEWLPQARDQIRAGQYRYLSPAIRFGTKDRVTGKPAGARLSSAALTNEPFLDGMQPLAAKDQGAVSTETVVTMASAGPGALVHQPHEYMPKIRAALKLDELADHASCSDKLDRLRECCMSAGPHGVYEGVNLSEHITPLRDLMGANPGTTVEELLDQVQDLIDEALEQHVEQYHGGSASMSTKTGTEPDNTSGAAGTEKPMPTEAELVTLKDANTALTTAKTTLEGEKVTLSTKVTTLETEVSTVTLKLKGETARADTAETCLTAVKATVTLKDGEKLEDAVKRISEENTKLLADKAQRDEADLHADVDVAFAVYKDVRKLTEGDKTHMLSVAKADRSAFNGMFPPVSVEQRALLRNVVPPEQRPTVEEAKDENSLTALTAKLQGQGMSYTQASVEASRQLNAKNKR